MRCKRQGCPESLSASLIRRGMCYCSADCAPFGRYGMEDSSKEARHQRWRGEIDALIAQGLNAPAIAGRLGLTLRALYDRARLAGVLDDLRGPRESRTGEPSRPAPPR